MLVLDGAQEIYNSPGWLVFQADGEEAEAGADEVGGACYFAEDVGPCGFDHAGHCDSDRGLGMGILVVHSRAASFVPFCGTAYGSLVIVESLRRFLQKANVSWVCW